jgi:hypothetical protein
MLLRPFFNRYRNTICSHSCKTLLFLPRLDDAFETQVDCCYQRPVDKGLPFDFPVERLAFCEPTRTGIYALCVFRWLNVRNVIALVKLKDVFFFFLFTNAGVGQFDPNTVPLRVYRTREIGRKIYYFICGFISISVIGSFFKPTSNACALQWRRCTEDD